MRRSLEEPARARRGLRPDALEGRGWRSSSAGSAEQLESRQPPSSDGLTEPARRGACRTGPAETGAPRAAKGETLRQVAEPDVVVDRSRRPAPGAARAWIRTRASATAPGRCSICPTRGPSSSPSIVRTIAAAPVPARERGAVSGRRQRAVQYEPADRCVCTLSCTTSSAREASGRVDGRSSSG